MREIACESQIAAYQGVLTAGCAVPGGRAIDNCRSAALIVTSDGLTVLDVDVVSFPLSVSFGLVGAFSVGFFPAGVVPSVVLLFMGCCTDSSPTACGSLLQFKKQQLDSKY